jgi:PKHD-type hydroxylase
LFTNRYWHFHKALTDSELNYLQEVAHEGLKDGNPAIHMGNEPEKRLSTIHWSFDKRALQICTSLIYEANRNAGWWLDIETPEAVQMTEYKENNAGYDWHIDSKADQLSKRLWAETNLDPMPLDRTTDIELLGQVRKLSLTLNLSDPESYEGGELEIQIDNEKHCFKGNAGSATVFPSWTYHRVAPITDGTRHSAVLWMNGPPLH